MKNHFARIGLTPPESDHELDDLPVVSADTLTGGSAGMAAGALTADGDPVLREDIEAARDILRDPERRKHYRRVCRQYRAMADALDVLDAPGAVDSHRWRERLVEFGPDDTASDEPIG